MPQITLRGPKRLALALVVGLVLSPVAAMAADQAKAQSLLWFDPTQLPSFSGTVESYLPNLHGEIDRLLLKEGAQIAFPPSAYEHVRAMAPVGKSLVVWGIRARNAPVITMLAYAASAESEPTVLDRFYWHPDSDGSVGKQQLNVSGEIKAPYLSPQGEIAGGILTDGTIIAVLPAVAAKLKDRFAPDAKIAASGHGYDGPNGKALIAEEVGETPDTLKPLPPVDQKTPPAPSHH